MLVETAGEVVAGAAAAADDVDGIVEGAALFGLRTMVGSWFETMFGEIELTLIDEDEEDAGTLAEEGTATTAAFVGVSCDPEANLRQGRRV